MFKFFLIYILLLLPFITYSQNKTYVNNNHLTALEILDDRGEIEFEFECDSIDLVDFDLGHIISIDNIKKLPDKTCYYVKASADETQFLNFLKLKIHYNPITPDQLRSLKMADSISEMKNWDAYPTYQLYEIMMAEFAGKYPDLCKIDTILSQTPSGNYRILTAKITDNINDVENEPRFLYSSSMHGNETAGFIILLRLIDHLLSNYSTSEQVKYLIDNVEIWICPLANPDATYYKSDPPGSTVAYAKRTNYYNVNLNRNYPDPVYGPNPDGKEYQPETNAFMSFADKHNFDIGANIHSGAELLNYPWDCWRSIDNPNADAGWWEKVCTDYVDTARSVSPYYMTSEFADGVSEGGDWYVINGGRQDYMNYFKNCRELTIEIDNVLITETQNLNNKWNANYRSLLNFIRESTYGIQGIVTDSLTGKPLRARLWVNNYDQENDSSQVYSVLPLGCYHKYMIGGEYSLTFSATGYISKTYEKITLKNGSPVIQDVKLVPVLNDLSDNNKFCSSDIFPNPASDILTIKLQDKYKKHINCRIYSSSGQLVMKSIIMDPGNEFEIDISTLSNGLYFLIIQNSEYYKIGKFQKN